ncbi:type II toxin-antitoxin system VapC family toxin [Thermofilum sp.]|jgi:predicted nucleic acid-binding protein|uniref:type II toxin-antitoxin system VapC family toxin n=1 Tax=Thermofilum sp. TaxID=1961369 RepID=UPI00258F8687|nr:type II toxin-antitoxin system VapC family toxin [Thermofilum sp.]
MKNPIVYLDSSTIVKRYIEEAGSEVARDVYNSALAGNLTLSFSAWNIGEVLGVLDRYRRRAWLDDESYVAARMMFIGETIRLLKLGALILVPIRVRLLAEAWRLLEKYHIYQADALQVVSAKYVKANKMYTGDRSLHNVALAEGLQSVILK